MAEGRVRSVLDSLAAVCVSAASIAVIWNVVESRSGPNVLPSGTNVQPIENVDDKRLKIPVQFAEGGGQMNAKVALVEFSDFQCPFCGRYAQETLPAVRREFVETDKIAYVFKNFPLEGLHPHALGAAQAAVCAKRNAKFWEMHEWLFLNQTALGPPNVAARLAKLDIVGDAEACLADADNVVQQDMAEGRRLGVNSTPTFFLGQVGDDGMLSLRRRINGAVPYDAFKSGIEEMLTLEVKK